MAARRGYVKLHRELMDHPIFAHDGLYRLWSYCLLRANWKDADWMIPGTTTSVTVKRGQFITGRESLHADLYGSEYSGGESQKPVSRTLWRWLETLERMRCIDTQNMSNRCTLVTVCNYETYQNDDSGECPTEIDVTPQKIIVSNGLDENRKEQAANGISNKENSSSRQLNLSSNSDGSYVTSNDGRCPAAVQPVSSRCPTDVPLLSTNKELQEPKKNKKVIQADDVTIPTALETPEVRAALSEWLEYKRTRGEGYKQASFVNHLLAEYAPLGPLAFVQAVSYTIGRNYAGLVPPNRGTSRQAVTAGQSHDPDAAKKDPNHGRM